MALHPPNPSIELCETTDIWVLRLRMDLIDISYMIEDEE
jgi:hypothetical protein